VACLFVLNVIFAPRFALARITCSCLCWGELFDVVNSHEQHAQLSESLLRRIWRELVSAVEWMRCKRASLSTVTSSSKVRQHLPLKKESGVAHRGPPDSANPFTTLTPEANPLVKLTQISGSHAKSTPTTRLCMRCGSESYAALAPELFRSTQHRGRRTSYSPHSHTHHPMHTAPRTSRMRLLSNNRAHVRRQQNGHLSARPHPIRACHTRITVRPPPPPRSCSMRPPRRRRRGTGAQTMGLACRAWGVDLACSCC
jgi:hypothetical protein